MKELGYPSVPCRFSPTPFTRSTDVKIVATIRDVLVDAISLSSMQPEPRTAKELGAYYTDQEVADFLVWWAVRTHADRVIDPSFGGGVFLRAACKRLVQLKGSPAVQVFGVEIDRGVFSQISQKLANEFGVRASHLYPVDFFNFDGPPVLVDAVVGNPPFIRYQRFSGDVRQQALQRAAQAGVKLSELSSSWAPFLVHSVSMLKEGGRLAMVVPAELAHAAYAKPLLAFLERSFSTIGIATFRKKLFPNLSEDTFLLMAEGKGGGPGRFEHKDFAHAEELTRAHLSPRQARPKFRPMELGDTENRLRLSQHFLPHRISSLYEVLRSHSNVVRLGEIADVGIGYVTGANDFFHLTSQDAQRWRIPARFLRPAVKNTRGLKGTQITVDDWVAKGEEYLLHVPSNTEVPSELTDYLSEGQRRGVHLGYKCRTRKHWYEVPHVYRPDALLSYMSGNAPRLLANPAGAVAPNTLHVIRLAAQSDLSGSALSSRWPNSLTALSSEVEGHSLGGGMLKLEPTEAEMLLIPNLSRNRDGADFEIEVDRLVRAGSAAEVQVIVDRRFLQEGLGLSKRECTLLRQGAELLRERRYARSAS